jgi:hypothetical protein
MSSPDFFIDRPETDQFLSKLTQALHDPANNPLVFHVWGIGGVGKTTLAHKIKEQHPEAVIIPVSFGSTLGVETILKLMKYIHNQLKYKGPTEDKFTERWQEYEKGRCGLEREPDSKELLKMLGSVAQVVSSGDRTALAITKQVSQLTTQGLDAIGIIDQLDALLNRFRIRCRFSRRHW